MYVEDIILAKEALKGAAKFIEAQISLIEKRDLHPLSWAVATEFRKLKRTRLDMDSEDDKIFVAAEKKVKEDEAKSEQKITFMQRPSEPQGRFGNVVK